MTEPVLLCCPECGYEIPVHIAYGHPDDPVPPVEPPDNDHSPRVQHPVRRQDAP